MAGVSENQRNVFYSLEKLRSEAVRVNLREKNYKGSPDNTV